MAGLIDKDIRLLWKTKQTLGILFAIAVAVAFSNDGTFILWYLPFVTVMVTICSITYDEMDHGYQFLLTLPVSKKTYVKEKYLLCSGGTAAAWAIALCLHFISQAVRGVPIAFADNMLTATVILPLVLMISFFMIPAQIKFGNEKSRIMMLGIIGVIALAGYVCKVLVGAERILSLLTFLDRINEAVVFGGIIGITMLILVLSYQISRRIMEKKEF